MKRKRAFIVDVSDVNSPDFVRPTTVLLNGVDISNRCSRAAVYSDGTGIAHCFKQREDPRTGKMGPYLTPDGLHVERELLTGGIQIIRPQRAA